MDDTAHTDITHPRSSVLARRTLLAVGVVAMAGAIALLAAFVIDLTSGSSTTVDPAFAARYRGDPGGVYDRLVVTPTRTPKPTATPAPSGPPLKNAPFQIEIERIGVDAPVNAYGLDATGTPIVPLNASEVAWYDWSAPPGTGSNAVFAGHVTWSGRAVFYQLNTLVAGDTVRLVGQDGTELLYTVKETFLVDPLDPSALQVMSPTSEDLITIITCDGSFYYTGDPVFNGDYTNRRVVRAGLTSITSPAPVPAPAG